MTSLPISEHGALYIPSMSVSQKIRKVWKIQGSWKQIWPLLNQELVRILFAICFSFSLFFLFFIFYIANLLVSFDTLDDIRGGDIAIRFWKDLRENALKETPDAKVGAEDMVLVEWPLALILTRKI